MRIIGVDPGIVSPGICYLDSETKHFEFMLINPDQTIKEQICLFLNTHDFDLIVVERQLNYNCIKQIGWFEIIAFQKNKQFLQISSTFKGKTNAFTDRNIKKKKTYQCLRDLGYPTKLNTDYADALLIALKGVENKL